MISQSQFEWRLAQFNTRHGLCLRVTWRKGRGTVSALYPLLGHSGTVTQLYQWFTGYEMGYEDSRGLGYDALSHSFTIPEEQGAPNGD